MEAMSCITSLNESLNAAQTTSRDAVLVDLATRYATAIDAGGDLARLGPQFHRVLDSLGLTRARKEPANDRPDDEPSGPTAIRNPLDELRRRRRDRQRDPAPVDTATP